MAEKPEAELAASYRMAVKAGVCFTVEASTEKEAVEKAKAVRDRFCEGLSVDVGESSLDMRVYLDEADEPSIENIEESDPGN
jgi:hypothetical protein